MITTLVTCGSMIAMGLMATVLVMDKKYRDRLVKRFALVGMIISSFIVSALVYFGITGDYPIEEYITPEAMDLLTSVFMASTAVFMLMHMVNYFKWRSDEDDDWTGR